MPGIASYCYDAGGNGKVQDDKEKPRLNAGEGSDCWAWGRFLSVDPLTSAFPHLTPYQFAGLRPIQAIDLDGLEPHDVTGTNGNKATVYGPYKDNESAQDAFDNSQNQMASYDLNPVDFVVYQSRMDNHSFGMDDLPANYQGGLPVGSKKVNAASMNGLSIEGYAGGGISLELGYATDELGETSAYFRVGGGIGLGGGVGYENTTLTRGDQLNGPVTLETMSGRDINYTIMGGPLGYSWGGNWDVKANGTFGYGNLYSHGSNEIGLNVNDFKRLRDLPIRGIAKSVKGMGGQASVNWGSTYMFKLPWQ